MDPLVERFQVFHLELIPHFGVYGVWEGGNFYGTLWGEDSSTWVKALQQHMAATPPTSLSYFFHAGFWVGLVCLSSLDDAPDATANAWTTKKMMHLVLVHNEL